MIFRRPKLTFSSFYVTLKKMSLYASITGLTIFILDLRYHGLRGFICYCIYSLYTAGTGLCNDTRDTDASVPYISTTAIYGTEASVSCVSLRRPVPALYKLSLIHI